MAFLWRGLLVRRHAVDRGARTGIDLVYADRHRHRVRRQRGALRGAAAGRVHVAHATRAFTVFTRALVVPSSGRRTAIVVDGDVRADAGRRRSCSPRRLGRRSCPGPAYVVGCAHVRRRSRSCSRRSARASSTACAARSARRCSSASTRSTARSARAASARCTARTTRCCAGRPRSSCCCPIAVGAENLDRFEREVQHMSQLTHPNTVAVLRLRPQPRRRLLLRDGVPRRHRPRAPRDDARPAAGGARRPRSSSRCAARSTRRTTAASSTATSSRRTSSCASAAACPTSRRSSTSASSRRSRATPTASDAGRSSARRRTSRPRRSPIRSTIGPAVDLYALGAVGYFLLTGQPRVRGQDRGRHLHPARHGSRRRRRREVAAIHVPPALEALILKCLAKRPGRSLRVRRPRSPRRSTRSRARRDWGRDDARRWWREFRAREAAPPPSAAAPTLTITVDLGDRA